MPRFTDRRVAKPSLAQRFSSVFAKKQAASASPFAMGGYGHTYIHAPGKPVWSSREYARFAEEGYVKNVIAHRAVHMIASAAAHISWQVDEQGKGRRQKLLSEHPLIDLLNRPNPSQSRAEFFESLHSYRLIGGNAFVQAIAPSNGAVRELHLLRPDRVAVIAGKTSVAAGYRYTVGDSYRDYKVDPITGRSDILHLKRFHPTDDWYGLSALEPAAYAIDQHNQSSQWNQSLLQNGARPSGALVVKAGDNKSGYLSEEQYQRIRTQVDEAHSGPENAGKPLLLEGGLEWKEMSLSPKDMDFLNIKHSSARDIALSFGVPPQLLGIPGDNTYANLAEARLALWEQTIVPLLDYTMDSLNHWLAPHFGKQVRLTYNKDAIEALSPRRKELWDRISNADFLSDEEKRVMLGV